MQTILINSTNKDFAGDTHSKFSYTIRESIAVNTSGIRNAFLTSVIVPRSYYEIVTGLNDVIRFVDAASNKIATLSAGTYTHTQIATEVASKLNAASVDVITVTYDAITDLYTFGSSSNLQFIWAGPTQGTAFTLLGFQEVDTASTTSFTSTVSPKISEALVNISIGFDENNSQLLQGPNSNHTFELPIVSDFTEIIVYKPDIPLHIQRFDSNTTIKKLNIELFREDGITNLDLRGRNIIIEIKFQ